MSFYTALTGLNGSSADISATSNNIANVGTTGFKRSRAEFGDIFATSPLQNASSSIGSGTILKGVKQQFTQGNIAASLNALDLAISGQGFFALKPSLTSTQTVYTRNGSLNVNNDRYVVDSAGQYLLTYPVNTDGSVTAKDLNSAVPLQLPVTSGAPQATGLIELGVNVPAEADVVTERAAFSDGYAFNPDDSNTYTNSTSITIFDDLGNPTIATIYFIKTQSASADDPTNKYDTRLVINDTVINPDLVAAVDDSGAGIFVDRFGMQTTTVPDDNYFLEGKGSPLYKLDDLQTLVPSTPAEVRGEGGANLGFDFGEEGDRLVEIVTDPTQFNATRESGDTDSEIYWGKNFLSLNVDNSDQPVNIDIRPGKYNAAQLALEVERAANEAYGDDSKIQIVQNVDDVLNINLFKLNADGASTGLTSTVAVDLLSASYVSTVEDINLTGASPDFTREQFLAHTQARINASLNTYASTDANATALGVDTQFFARSSGQQMDAILTETQIVEFRHTQSTDATPAVADTSSATNYMVYSYQGAKPSLSVYDNKAQLGVGDTLVYDATQNTLTVTVIDASDISVNESIRIAGTFDTTVAAQDSAKTHLNGREFSVTAVDTATNTITINTTGMSFPEAGFTVTGNTDIHVMSDESTDVEAFFEGSENVFEGAKVNFSSEKIILREMSTDGKHAYRNDDITSLGVVGNFTQAGTMVAAAATYAAVAAAGGTGTGATFNVTVSAAGVVTKIEVANGGSAYASGDTLTLDGASLGGVTTTNDLTLTLGDVAGIFTIDNTVFDVEQTVDGTALDSLDVLGFRTVADVNAVTTSTEWVDEKAPPIKVSYDSTNQNLQFSVDRTILGTGTESNFNSFTVFGAASATSNNNLGVPNQDDSSEVLIRGGTFLSTDPIVANGEEIQLNDKRFGVGVIYNADTQSFSFKSGTTGEAIAADGALNVVTAQTASSIAVGRHTLSTVDGSVVTGSLAFSGDNHLMGVGASKTDAVTTAGKGLASTAAVATGAAAIDDLSEVFNLTSTSGDNIFNVSVNGINGVVEVPSGFYVGSTLAQALETRINQIMDSTTGETVGGVTVAYQSEGNNFVFTTGTTGDTSTIKVKGASRLGLAEVALGVGNVPNIYNLVQATNAQGVQLYVDSTGAVVETPPANLVEGYYPLYIDEGELTFSKSGSLVSPKNKVHFERQEQGFSIDLDIDFTASTQFAQPFSVTTVNQDGFTSGRLDGLEIDASGTVRANYTNGQNNPLGKIVLANFNNQNGLKQIGNATYTETAVSGAASVGEAGAEGFGTILSGSLERSNVDITEELVNLITAQRNFQASAKAIETTTTLTQTIINIRM